MTGLVDPRRMVSTPSAAPRRSARFEELTPEATSTGSGSPTPRRRPIHSPRSSKAERPATAGGGSLAGGQGPRRRLGYPSARNLSGRASPTRTGGVTPRSRGGSAPQWSEMIARTAMEGDSLASERETVATRRPAQCTSVPSALDRRPRRTVQFELRGLLWVTEVDAAGRLARDRGTFRRRRPPRGAARGIGPAGSPATQVAAVFAHPDDRAAGGDSKYPRPGRAWGGAPRTKSGPDRGSAA
jgi:hypothetical protein